MKIFQIRNKMLRIHAYLADNPAAAQIVLDRLPKIDNKNLFQGINPRKREYWRRRRLGLSK